jgi:PTH1 family peptidyl-tRNA hydrolase
MLETIADCLAFAAQGDDERFPAEVMRLAPAEKADPRKKAREDD